MLFLLGMVWFGPFSCLIRGADLAALGDKRLTGVQIAAVYDLMGDPHGALEWFERLNMRVPQDPGVLARLGALHARYQNISALADCQLSRWLTVTTSTNVCCWLQLGICICQETHHKKHNTHVQYVLSDSCHLSCENKAAKCC